MKKKSVRALSIFLCVVMLACLFPASAFADNACPHYGVYTVLGDSNPSGFGLEAYMINAGGMKIWDGDRISGSYPDIVANAITADKVNVFSHCAWRVNELMRAIDPEYDWKDGYSDMYLTGLNYDNRFGFKTNDFVAQIPAAIEEANIITMQFGSNDIFTHAVNRTTDAFPDLLDSLMIELPETYDENTLCTILFSVAEKAGILADVAAKFIYFLGDNCQIFKSNMERAIAKVREMNPTAQIYVVGVLNSVNQTYQTDCGAFLSLPTTVDARILDVNCYLKQVCDKTENCIYVDVPFTDMFGITVLDIEETLDDDIYYTALQIVHPTEKGHAYMAQQIINAIKDNAAPAPAVSVTKSTILKKNIIKWDSNKDASMYRIYRSTSENGEYYYIGSTALNFFYDGISFSSIPHYYKVCAVMSYSSGIVSPMSAPAHA